MNDNNILAVVLAGGKSKRFGQDKNCVKLGSKTLLEHVLFKISNKFEEILIVSSNPLKIEEAKNTTVIPDCFNDPGPLAGVLSSMKWVKEHKNGLQLFHLILHFLIQLLLKNTKQELNKVKAVYILLNLTKKDIIFLVYGQLI